MARLAGCQCPAIHKGKSTVNKVGFFLDHCGMCAVVLPEFYSPASRSGGDAPASARRNGALPADIVPRHRYHALAPGELDLEDI